MFKLYFRPSTSDPYLLPYIGEVEIVAEVKPFVIPQEDRMWAIRSLDSGNETLAFWYELEVRED